MWGVVFAGGATECFQGARNEYENAGGGRILRIGIIHAVYIPPDAMGDDLVGNAGTYVDGGGKVIKERYWCGDMTVAQAEDIGLDITEWVLEHVSSSV